MKVIVAARALGKLRDAESAALLRAKMEEAGLDVRIRQAILYALTDLEGKGATVLDQLGMAQKGGAVISHVRIGATPEALHAMRLGAGGANLLLGCDLVVSASADALARLEPGSGPLSPA